MRMGDLSIVLQLLHFFFFKNWKFFSGLSLALLKLFQDILFYCDHCEGCYFPYLIFSPLGRLLIFWVNFVPDYFRLLISPKLWWCWAMAKHLSPCLPTRYPSLNINIISCRIHPRKRVMVEFSCHYTIASLSALEEKTTMTKLWRGGEVGK